MTDARQIEQHLNALPWNSAEAITPDAQPLIQEHLRKIRVVIAHLVRNQGRTPVDAYADAQSAGYQADGYEAFLQMLFKRVTYRSAPAKEPLILTIASHFFWKEDPDLGHLEDPWAPLFKLYAMGYTSTFDQDDERQTLTLIVGYRGGEAVYPLWDER
jgi:hypothetical protein